MKTFTVNQNLSARSIGNADCTFEGVVIKRTTKTVTVSTDIEGVKRCKINKDNNGNEYIFPYGRYSMAPIFRA